MTDALTRYSKTDDVLLQIGALNSGVIPLDEDFGFRERAKRLVEQWKKYLLNQPDIKHRSILLLDDMRQL
ncbi:hypothetical protein BT96DRAFT_925540 [Gymnopus androsaceus JB14]|uniref:Uncharacterized protein n=1 Tax=Gymnopus androsaceus JB14 TaxID=1447944 RepID=A0A6A4GZU6_9AGAR|nr:hypothetical protein BT96DRAFT_925540 [Gymnopus androsaceus JB14]